MCIYGVLLIPLSDVNDGDDDGFRRSPKVLPAPRSGGLASCTRLGAYSFVLTWDFLARLVSRLLKRLVF